VKWEKYKKQCDRNKMFLDEYLNVVVVMCESGNPAAAQISVN